MSGQKRFAKTKKRDKGTNPKGGDENEIEEKLEDEGSIPKGEDEDEEETAPVDVLPEDMEEDENKTSTEIANEEKNTTTITSPGNGVNNGSNTPNNSINATSSGNNVPRQVLVGGTNGNAPNTASGNSPKLDDEDGNEDTIVDRSTLALELLKPEKSGYQLNESLDGIFQSTQYPFTKQKYKKIMEKYEWPENRTPFVSISNGEATANFTKEDKARDQEMHRQEKRLRNLLCIALKNVNDFINRESDDIILESMMDLNRLLINDLEYIQKLRENLCTRALNGEVERTTVDGLPAIYALSKEQLREIKQHKKLKKEVAAEKRKKYQGPRYKNFSNSYNNNSNQYSNYNNNANNAPRPYGGRGRGGSRNRGKSVAPLRKQRPQGSAEDSGAAED
jgi:hypothetical protein